MTPRLLPALVVGLALLAPPALAQPARQNELSLGVTTFSDLSYMRPSPGFMAVEGAFHRHVASEGPWNTLRIGGGLRTGMPAGGANFPLEGFVEARLSARLSEWAHEAAGKQLCHLTRQKAGELMQARFEQLGLRMRRQETHGTPFSTSNIIAELPGTSRPEESVLVGAHYDAYHAGADDNTTGVATVLKLARVLSQHKFERTLRFVGFDFEEYGVVGSARYVDTRNEHPERIVGWRPAAMKRFDARGLLACALVVLLSGGSARAQEAAPAEAGVPTTGHQLTFYSRAGALVYLSDAMTTGGVGGGVGVRDTLHDRFILQADLNYLMVIGNAAALRLGAGLQRSGTYTPAVLLSLTTVVRDRLTFLTPEHPTPARIPAMSLGLTVAPLRFTQGGMQLSVLEPGVGAGTDLPGLGLTWQLGLLEVGTSVQVP